MSPNAFQSSDITTDPEQATSGSSALSKYMQKMQQNSDQFMESLYTSTIDRPCLSACEHNEAMDYFVNCRQPLSFLPFVTKEVDSGSSTIEYEMPLPGAYEVPTTCEYCGAGHVSNCTTDCQRPKLFFAKQRPPFVPVGGSSNGRCSTVKWDPVTDYEQVKEEVPAVMEKVGDAPDMVDEDAMSEGKQSSTSWMEDLFRGTTATMVSSR